MKAKITGLNNVTRALERFPDRVKKEVGMEFKAAAQEIERLAKRAAPVDQGQLMRTITTKSKEDINYEVVAQNQIAPIQEFGTKSNVRVDPEFRTYAMTFKGMKVAGEGTLFTNILAWVKRKKISGNYSTRSRRRIGGASTKEAEDRSAAYMISAKIRKEGVKAKPFLMPAFKEVKAKLIKRIVNILK